MATAEEQQGLTGNVATANVVIDAGDADQHQPVRRQIVDDTKGIDDKCKIKILIAFNILLIAIIIIVVLCGVYADAFAQYTECNNICPTMEDNICPSIEYDEDVEIPDGNQYEFNTTVCEDYRDLWDDPSIPLDERNQIGRAIFQTPKKMQQAIELIKYGKSYNLYRPYSSRMPFAFGRYFNTTLICGYYPQWDAGSCTQELVTNAIGNVGTQFDSFGHFFSVDIDNRSSIPENFDFVLFNNFRGDDVFENDLRGDNNDGVQYLGVEKLPTFFTRAILVDIAGYKDVERLPDYYSITVDDFTNALEAQSLSVENITKGDVVLTYTGWSVFYDTDPVLYYDWDRTPGISEAVVLEILYPRNVMIVGSDTWGTDTLGLDEWATHQVFLACGGGLNHEMLKLDEWVMDAREGDAPWIGAYVYQPLPVLGAVASPGKPVVFV